MMMKRKTFMTGLAVGLIAPGRLPAQTASSRRRTATTQETLW